MRVLRELRHQFRWALPLWFVGLLTNWWPDNRWTIRWRGMMVAPFLGKCGRNLQLGSLVTLLGTDRLAVGNDVYLARGTWLNAMGGLELADEVVLGPYVVISTAQHVFKAGSVRFAGSIVRPIAIGRGSWLAAHAVVKCGVRIGAGCLVAANSVVTKDVPDQSIVGGVPAKVIGSVRDEAADIYRRDDLRGAADGPA